MTAQGPATGERRQVKRDLLRKYVRLQRDILDGDPASSAYAATIQSFRELGYALINNGFEDDLDRLLRIRVLDGGRAIRSDRSERKFPKDLQVIESRAARS